VAEEVAGFFVLLRSSGMGDKTDLGDDVSTDCFSIAPLPRDGDEVKDFFPFSPGVDGTEVRAAARRRLAASRLAATAAVRVNDDFGGGWRGGGGGGGFFIIYFYLVEMKLMLRC
jgi:hypothetical protein